MADGEGRNPWTVLGTERRHEDSFIALDEHRVRDAAGRERPYATVRFKRRGCVVVPVDAEGGTVLVGRWRFAAGRYSWEVPAGGARPDEDPEDAARRELGEEAGLEARRWLELLRLSVSGAITDERAVCFAAWGLSPRERRPDPQEVVEVRRVPFAAAVRMVLAGEVVEAASVAAIPALHARAARGELPPDLASLLRG